jgi:ATP-binding cassette subfamily B protein
MSWWDPNLDEDATEARERRFSGRQVLAHLLPYFRTQLGVLRRAAGLLVLMTAADLAGPQILRRVLNGALAGGTGPQVFGLALLFIAVTAASLGLNYVVSLLVNRAGLGIVTTLKERLFRHILSLPFGFFQAYPPGKLLARVESDTESLKQLFSLAAVRLLHSGLVFCGILALLLFEDPAITAAVLGCLVLLAGLMALVLRRVRRLWRMARRRYADLSALVAEYVGAVDVIQHYRYAPRAEERLSQLGAAKLAIDLRANYLDHGFWGVFGFFEAAIVAVVVAVGARKIASGQMDVGTLVLFIEYLRQAFAPILALSEFVNLVQRSFVAAERVFGILAIERDDLRFLPVHSGGAGVEERDVPFEREIAFEAVSFAYAEGRPVVQDVSFSIRKGQKVAFVGPSGGGKSTIANLLMYFYEPSAGRITVDGVDLRQYSRRAWRRQVGLVLQGVHLFPGTLRDNLSVFDPDCPDPVLVRALQTVQALPLVDGLPGGLAAELAERGANLSLGERQLLSFARALVHDPPLLVLDEATSSVDPVTERRIQESLERLLAGRTAFIIAHRLSTIRSADRIFVVLDGRIVESGTHEELYRAGRAYRRLFDLQFRNGTGAAA